MAETTPHSKVIRQNDDSLPKHLDFNRLREEGLVHIGNLSGKIWTDHNTHDPGITTLEVLCYALLDLGYRASLPIEDLLAQKDGAQDDNFFTPAEILSCNPVTITDYRKLLLEIEGVRNAWLEPVTKRNPRLFLDFSLTSSEKIGVLCCCECEEKSDPVSGNGQTSLGDEKEDCGCKEPPERCVERHCIDLNGLYHVYLELEKEMYEALEQEKKSEADCRKLCLDKCADQGEGFDLKSCVEKCREKRTAFFKQVQCVLSAHRNLCEDFEDITILCPQKVGLCAEVEVLPGTDADKVYAEILRRLSDYISPTARFYSLQALLEKGRPIEEIFAGRPHSLKSIFGKGVQDTAAPDICASFFENTTEAVFESFGFIDTEELENISLKKEIHLSDLYSVIHSVEGVYSVKNLCINSNETGLQTHGTDNPGCDFSDEGTSQTKWRFQLLEDTVPVFVFEDMVNGVPLTNIQFSTTTGAVPVNKKKVHAELTRYRKSRLSDEFLNTAIPTGMLREDLDEYISIQNDFPRVYGIGEVGLPETATLLRKTQARQFQGYLLFYDQLLADYLKQLNHLRDLFSLQQESLRPASKLNSAYSGPLNPDLTPGLNKLVRLLAAKDQGIMEGGVMALPVFNNDVLENALCKIEATLNGKLVVQSQGGCFEAESSDCDEVIGPAEFKRAFRRDSALHNIRRALDKKQYETDIRQDKAGWYFIIRFETVSSLVLVGTNHYEFAHEAESAARLTAFLGTWEQNLNRAGYESGSVWKYTFQVVSRSIDYALFLQNLAENESAYLERRETFLDHLLSRFSEKFTEYAAMMFDQVQDEQTRRRMSVEDKSKFLSSYDDISRNRGRAFDYLQPSWGTHNISGFERRAMLLAGFSGDRRRSLCNVEVFEKMPPCEVTLQDWHGANLLVSLDPVPATSTGEKVAAALHKALKSDAPFQVGYDPATQKYSLGIRAGYVRFQYPGELESEFDANEKGRQIKALFAQKTGPENVKETSFAYTQELVSLRGEVQMTGSPFVSEKEAKATKQINEFIKSINRSDAGKKEAANTWNLSPLQGSANRYINLAAFNSSVAPCPTKWKWQLYDEKKKAYSPSAGFFYSEQEALDDFIKTRLDKNAVFQVGNGRNWEVTLDGKIALQGARIYADTTKATTAWRQAKEWGTSVKNYSVAATGDQRFRIELHNGKGGLVAHTNELDATVQNVETIITECIKAFDNKKIKPKTPVRENCWGFRINSGKGQVLLAGYCLYPTAATALEAWLEAQGVGGEANLYVKSGDETNLNYIFLLKDRQNKFIAEIPQAFDNPGERDKAHRAVLETLKNQKLPLLIVEEPPTWAFHLFDKQARPLCHSLTEYESADAAREAFTTFLPALEDARSVPVIKDTLQTDLAIVAVTGDEPKRLLEPLSVMVQSQIYTFNVRKIPSGYRFYYYWEWPKGSYEPLFESIREFGNEEEAKGAYINFAENLYRAELKQEGTGKNVSLLVLMPGENEPVAQATTTAAQHPAAVNQFFEYASSHLTDQVASYAAWVNQPAAGTGQYSFRLVKKGQPFAVAPCNTQLDKPKVTTDDITCYPPLTEADKKAAQSCFEPVPLPDRGDYRPRRACYTREEAEKHSCDQCIKNPGDYNWLDVCTGTTDVVQKPTGENCICKYHFVVKGRIGKGAMTEMFYSIIGYDTEAQAIAAYQEQFLGILQVASCEENYGAGKKICTKDCFNIQPDDCGKVGDFIAAVAPGFENDIPKLAEWARSFPVRYFDVWENGKKIRKYYFRLYDKDADRFEWQSWACYDTFDEAWQAFMKLLQLLACKDNCRVGAIEAGCEIPSPNGQKFQVEIREVLVTSQWCYGSKDEAWGRDADCDQPVPSCPCDPPFKCPEEVPKNDPKKQSAAKNAIVTEGPGVQNVVVSGETSTGQDVEIKDCCCKIGVHPCCHPRSAFDPNNSENPNQLFLELVSTITPKGFDSTLLYENGHYYLAVHAQQSHALPCDYFIKGTIPYSTKEEGKAAIVKLKSKLKEGSYHIKILHDNQQDSYSFELYDDCCHYGVERFLFAAQDDKAFYPYEETDLATNTVKYGFYVVDACYRVATHPCWYDTEAAANQALEKLIEALNKLNTPSAQLDLVKFHTRDGKNYTKLIAEKLRNADTNNPVIQPCDCEEDEPDAYECDTLLIGVKAFDLEESAKKYTQSILAIHKKIIDGDKRYEYRIVSETDCGPWSIELVDTCCILGKTPCLFEDKYSRDSSMAMAKDCILAEGMHLLEHILLRPCVEDCAKDKKVERPCPGEDKTIQPCNPCLLQGCPDLACSLCWVDNPLEKDPCEKKANPPISYYPLADLYSFWATLVLPAWMKRFHDEDARAFFQHLLYQEAPAHIALNIVWLSPRQLCKFEEAYQHWLSWMQCPANDMDCGEMPGCCKEEPRLDATGIPISQKDCNLRCCMVETLTSLQPYHWCEPEPGEAGKGCGCGKNEVADQTDDDAPATKPGLKIKDGKIVNLFRCYDTPKNNGSKSKPANLQALHVIPVVTAAEAKAVPMPDAEITKPVLTKQVVEKKQPQPESTAPPANGNTARREFNNRMNERKMNAAALERQISEHQIFDRLANSFLNSAGLFTEFKKHTEFLIERTPNLASEALPEVVLLKNAIWHFLDKAINLEAEGKLFSNETDLRELLKKLKAKGFNIKAVADRWDEDEKVSRVFGKKQVNQFVKMLKK